MTTRPTGYPGWASGPSGWIAEPTALVKALGWQPNQAPPSSYENWFKNLVYQWTKYLDESVVSGLLGNARDGSLVVAGVTTYQVTRPLLLDTLTVTGLSSVLDTGGWPIVCKNRFEGVSGVVRCNGGNAASGVIGQPPAGPLRGAVGTGPMWSTINAFGGAGGAGGSGTLNGTSGGGSAVAPSGLWSLGANVVRALNDWAGADGTPTHSYFHGGAAGAIGGPGIGFAGMGLPGAGGGVVNIAAREVDFQGQFHARGGNGSAGSTGGGGGGGGGGGAINIAYLRKVNLSSTLDVRGGAGGTALTSSGSTGLYGATGATGIPTVNEIVLGAG